jgi:hypothetical protein
MTCGGKDTIESSPLVPTRPWTAAKHVVILLLHRMRPVLAQSVDSLRCEGSDAIGAKRTYRERRKRVDLTKKDPSATLAVHCGNGFDARFEPYQSTPLSR